jgi:gas vesicle protein
MGDNTEEHANDTSSTKSILIGLLVGGLAGAGAMLILAPQSGKRTRAQIRQKSIELRDRTTDALNSAQSQARVDAHEITADVRDKAGQLKQLGQDKIVKKLDRVSAVLDAGKTAIKDA